MTEDISYMKGDIHRLLETAEDMFQFLSRENVFDEETGLSISTWLEETPEPNNSSEFSRMKGDILRLRDILYHLLVNVFDPETEMEYVNLNYNWMMFGETKKDRMLQHEPQNQETAISQEEEISRMKDHIVWLQDTVYQLLGVVFDQGTQSEYIYASYNWMKYGKEYSKGWLNHNGEPDSDEEEDEEETHYFEYKYHMNNILFKQEAAL
jgi:uncharacterized protein YdcH (DUF465 family)